MSIVPNPTPCNDRYAIEKAWVTACGLSAVVARSRASATKHRCGYVAVLENNHTYGVSYNEAVPFITQADADNAELGVKSPVMILTATAGGDTEDSIRRSLDIVINVHGGLTYSSIKGLEAEQRVFPVATLVPAWWFGYDCAHYLDEEDGGQSLAYCVEQCESLAAQLQRFAK